MDFYLVKDLVHKNNLKGHQAACKENGWSPTEPYLEFNLKFPALIRPRGQSKPSREFAGKVREVVKRDYKKREPNAYFTLQFDDCYCNNDEKLLLIYINFDLFRGYDYETGFYSIFGLDTFKFEMTLSLCHLPTKDTPVSPDALFTLNRSMPWTGDDDLEWYGFRSDDEAEMEELEKMWSHETGYIYSKLTIVVTISEDGVKSVMEENKGEDLNEIQVMTRKMLEEELCTDLEIRCMDGNIVKGHRAVLGGRSKVFKAMFENKEMEEARTGILGMEKMSEEGVRGLLGWIYWGDEEKALEESDVAVEMLIAGDKWNLGGLVGKMEEIVLERRGYDEEWFSVESAVNLFGWARNLEGMKRFRDKAIAVLKLFGKIFPEKLVESEEYQDLIENDAEAAALFTGTPKTN